MNRTQERDEFIATMVQEGLPVSVVRQIISKANTIQRLSAAECNGDYPCDNGERPVCFCDICDAGYVRSAMKLEKPNLLICKNCITQEQIRKLLNAYRGFSPNFQGDPRGACVKIAVPSGKTNDMGREGICVPTREY